MKTAFIAWTPLHLINILNVYQNFTENQKEIYLFILNLNARRYSERIKN